MKISLFVKVTELNNLGEPFGTPVEFKANSLVNNFLNFIYGQWTGVNVTCKNTSGVSASRNLSGVMLCNAAVNINTSGIVIGTGNAAVTIDNYALQTQILQSTTGESGKMVHSVHALTAPVTVGSTRSFTISRVFTNNSGSTITIEEMGIIASFNAGFYLLDRTLYTKEVLNTNGVQITYTISITV